MLGVKIGIFIIFGVVSVLGLGCAVAFLPEYFNLDNKNLILLEVVLGLCAMLIIFTAIQKNNLLVGSFALLLILTMLELLGTIIVHMIL